ncbi:hypothetical protein [Pseudomonas aeruginosa]|uniref:hypothetical protein n=1 Tax=Pseudomonas aeruginosa TaxID=287 RepID=UPI0010683A06|nr:hypothetical protein [Pseudomonas aeruginosa]TEK52977.1 hypothetical protein IPC589_23930 [Pseudomonas aeruginosa]TEK56622.1 hypothetical protein IPC582_18060 [Pseudomonas aeruginosa]TEK62455.1 hypothetical protein IPC584_21165 [Pseudomonas aeruginosa]TEK73447.1 hypothetical protein IPC578_22430 [Pseudomonas aeruginosa]TEK82485.1 hypothetical protein IPC580_21355 [Pseudomonas aeruginosa]
MKLPVRQLGGDERGQALLRCSEAFPADWSTHRVLVLLSRPVRSIEQEAVKHEIERHSKHTFRKNVKADGENVMLFE